MHVTAETVGAHRRGGEVVPCGPENRLVERAVRRRARNRRVQERVVPGGDARRQGRLPLPVQSCKQAEQQPQRGAAAFTLLRGGRAQTQRHEAGAARLQASCGESGTSPVRPCGEWPRALWPRGHDIILGSTPNPIANPNCYTHVQLSGVGRRT